MSMSLPDETITSLLADVLRPGNFFVAPDAELDFEFGIVERCRWEVYRGRLFDRDQTRQEQTFLSWNVYWRLGGGERSGEPIISVKWDRQGQVLHFVRGLLCYVWEGYEAEHNVYLSREVTRWVREWLGSLALASIHGETELRSELAGRLLQAVVGLSRLPLTSAESPLPGFSLGEIGYFYRTAADQATSPMRTAQELLERGLTANQTWLEQAKLLELALRASPAEAVPSLATNFAARWRAAGRHESDIGRLLRTLLNEVSLSPYTSLVPNLLHFLQALVAQHKLPVADQIDFLSHVLRQLGRHLTAYDLIVFHHCGANYPDGLLLDAALREYLRLIEENPDDFLDEETNTLAELRRKRLRRRALRQGCLLRRAYEDLPVPDAPVSPGENTRVLPPPFERVPEEQISQPDKRQKKLYANDPLVNHLRPRGRRALNDALRDLEHASELQELGTAVFIDRPLGRAKVPGEPDQTLLFSHEAFSRTIAVRRLNLLEREFSADTDLSWRHLHEVLGQLSVRGFPARGYRSETGRVVSLADASRLVDDFFLLRTTPSVVREFLLRYAPEEVRNLFDQGVLLAEQVLIVPDPHHARETIVTLIIYDAHVRPHITLTADLGRGYVTRQGQESPAAGLQAQPVSRDE
jgi:hypothetical protein